MVPIRNIDIKKVCIYYIGTNGSPEKRTQIYKKNTRCERKKNKVDLMSEGATLAPANKKGNSGGRLRLRKTDKKRVAIQSSRGIQKGDSFN